MICVTVPFVYKVYSENKVLKFERENFDNRFQHFYLVGNESKNEESGYYEYSEYYKYEAMAKDILDDYNDFDQNLYFAYNRFPGDKIKNMNLLFEEISKVVHQNPEAYVGIPLYKSFDDYCLQKNFLDDLGRSDITSWKTYCVMLQKMEDREHAKMLTLHKSEN